MARLSRLLVEVNDGGVMWDGDGHEYDCRMKLFEWVRNRPESAVVLIPPRTLTLIRDNGIALYDRISHQDYGESQDDVLAVSAMVEDIWDALLEYQVGGERSHMTTMSLRWRWFDRRLSNEEYMIRIAG